MHDNNKNNNNFTYITEFSYYSFCTLFSGVCYIIEFFQ